jgi:hypothetical protein
MQKEKISNFLDWFINKPDSISSFITKNNGINIFKNAINSETNITWKRCIVLNFLLSKFTPDFQKNYVLTKWFSIDSIKLIYKFQQENKLITDGIFWEQSLKMLKQKCNIWNKNIIQLSNNSALNRIEKTDLDECAQYVTQSIMKLNNSISSKSIYTTLTWVIWNAWTMFDNIKSRGWSNLGSIFNIDKPLTNDPNVIKNHIKKLFKSNESTIKNIQRKIWDTVWLFYPKSSNHIKANNECKKTCNTHVWYIRWFTIDWIPIVSHNIHWTIHNQPINELYNTNDESNWCVVRWARPNLLSSIAQVEQQDKDDADQLLLNLDTQVA